MKISADRRTVILERVDGAEGSQIGAVYTWTRTGRGCDLCELRRSRYGGPMGTEKACENANRLSGRCGCTHSWLLVGGVSHRRLPVGGIE